MTTGFLRQRALINLSRASHVTVRGVEWISDGYTMARADLFKTPPKEGKYGVTIPTQAARKLLDSTRERGADVEDAHSRLTGHGTPEVLLLRRGAAVIGVNGAAASEWLRHDWSAITQVDGHPAVVFWQKRRGRMTVVGLLMPVRISHGVFGLEPLDGAA